MNLHAFSSPHDGGMSLAQERAYWGPRCRECDGDIDADLCAECQAESEAQDRRWEGLRCRAYRVKHGVTIEQIDAYNEATRDTACMTAGEIEEIEAGENEAHSHTWMPSVVDTVARVLGWEAGR